MSRPVVLALRALGLGDFLTGLPALKMLRYALPHHELVLAAPAVFAPIVPLVDAIDRLEPTPELMPVNRQLTGVDVAVDLHGKGPASRRLLAELRPRRLVGFADPVAGLPGPTWSAQEHEVDRWCRLVNEAFRCPDQRRPGVAGSVAIPPVDVPAGRTIIHPGAAARARRWPSERFVEVARYLGREGHRVVVTGGRMESSLAQAIAGASGAVAMLDLSLSQLFALVASARLVVSGDTGVAHVASTYRIPSVVLFGPVSPSAWGPPSDPRHLALFHGDGRGDPHGDEPDPALLRITVAEVVRAVDRVLAAVGADHLAVPSLPRRR